MRGRLIRRCRRCWDCGQLDEGLDTSRKCLRRGRILALRYGVSKCLFSNFRASPSKVESSSTGRLANCFRIWVPIEFSLRNPRSRERALRLELPLTRDRTYSSPSQDPDANDQADRTRTYCSVVSVSLSSPDRIYLAARQALRRLRQPRRDTNRHCFLPSHFEFLLTKCRKARRRMQGQVHFAARNGVVARLQL